MRDVLVVFTFGFLLALVHCYDRQRQKYACEGSRLDLDCPRTQQLQMLTANFGRTNKAICTGPNKDFNNTSCISTRAKKIIYVKCDKKLFCSVRASSSDLGGDPCPGVGKYIDVIYKCVRPVETTTQSLLTTSYSTGLPTMTPDSTVLPTKDRSTERSTANHRTNHRTLLNHPTMNIFDGNISTPDETNIKASSKKMDHGFFHSMLVLLVLMKEKPKHSLLSMLIGVAAGTVIVLITVLVCVCVDKRRQKKERTSFRDSAARKGEVIELEKSELLLGRKKGSNSDSARTDDQVDSAFCDDETDRQVSNDYESASDIAYLDAYLEEYNKNRSLPRPPVAENDYRNIGAQRMSRRAHNDGSKGRSYDYNSNNENHYTTFA